jgi:hypothetical protein
MFFTPVNTGENHSELVIKPVVASTGAQVPTYIGLPPPGATCPYTGLKRGTFYQLIAEGHIKSFVLRRPGRRRGRRLVDYQSLIEHLKACASAQEC